jgi:uncharacterized NAD(P)/FAD-binding protein YdhS
MVEASAILRILTRQESCLEGKFAFGMLPASSRARASSGGRSLTASISARLAHWADASLDVSHLRLDVGDSGVPAVIVRQRFGWNASTWPIARERSIVEHLLATWGQVRWRLAQRLCQAKWRNRVGKLRRESIMLNLGRYAPLDNSYLRRHADDTGMPAEVLAQRGTQPRPDRYRCRKNGH